MSVQQLSQEQSHLWLYQSQYFSLYRHQQHPLLWYVMKKLYSEGIHHLPSCLVHDVLFLLQRELKQGQEIQKNTWKQTLWYDFYTKLQQICFVTRQDRYLLRTDPQKDKIFDFFAMHILSTIASYWPKRFFVFEFSEDVLANLRTNDFQDGNDDEKEVDITSQQIIYTIEAYEEDIKTFLRSIEIPEFQKTLIDTDILSIARHISLLDKKDLQIAWLAFRRVTEQKYLIPLQPKQIVVLEEELDSVLEERNNLIYPRGGYQAISNRGSIHNLLPSQFAYQDIFMSVSDNHLTDTNTEGELQKTELDVFSLKYIKNELLFFDKDRGFLFRQKRQLIFVFEEDPIWLFHSTTLQMSMGIATLAFCQTLISSVLQIQNRDTIAVDIVTLKGNDSHEIYQEEASWSENMKYKKTSSKTEYHSKMTNVHQSFQKDILFLSLFCKEEISSRYHRTYHLDIDRDMVFLSKLQEKLQPLIRNHYQSHIFYVSAKQVNEAIKIPKISSYTNIPLFLQNENTERENLNSTQDVDESESSFGIHNAIHFTDIQKLHDRWVFEHLPIKSRMYE